jgi:hypothetical protein
VAEISRAPRWRQWTLAAPNATAVANVDDAGHERILSKKSLVETRTETMEMISKGYCIIYYCGDHAEDPAKRIKIGRYRVV